MIFIAKVATAIAWLVIVVNWLMPFSADYYSMIHFTGLGLLGAHALETALFLPKAKALNENMAVHALQLLIFGYPHNMQIEQQLKQQGV